MNRTEAPLFTPLSMQRTPCGIKDTVGASPSTLRLRLQSLSATLAHSPSALRVYLTADLGFQHGTLTPGEQQIVLWPPVTKTIAGIAQHRTARWQESSPMFQVKPLLQ